MSNTRCVIFLSIFGLGLLSATAQAQMVSSGSTGLVLNPTAELVPSGSTVIQSNFQNLGDLQARVPAEGFSTVTDSNGETVTATLPRKVSLGKLHTYGIYATRRLGDRLEVTLGATRLRVRDNKNPLYNEVNRTSGNLATASARVAATYDSGPEETDFALSAKYRLFGSGEPDATSVALGGGYNPALLGNTYAFLVASTRLAELGGRNVRGHLGVRYDRFTGGAFDDADFSTQVGYSYSGNANGMNVITSLDVNNIFSSRKTSVYSGIEVPLSRSGTYSFVGEIQSRNTDYRDGKSPFSAALRYTPKGERAFATVGAARNGLTGETKFVGQLGYRFGG